MIPFNRPFLAGGELSYIADAISRGPLSGDGYYAAQCQSQLASRTNGISTMLATSCTHALELSALLLNVGPGDEIILPSFTHPATASAFALRGAQPIFVDIRTDTLNIDETLIEQSITDRTKAIVVVHYAGVGCAMTEIARVADSHGIPLVEDNAHGLGGAYRDQPLGSFGSMAALSFHASKNVQCGEGGALLVNDPAYIERAEILRHSGTNRAEYFRGDADRYTWIDVGSSYLPSELLSAFLLAQLEAFDNIQTERHRVWNAYHEELGDWAADFGVVTPTVPDHCDHPAHLYYLLLPDLRERQAFIRHLRDRQIQAAFHYVPLHSSPQGSALGEGSAHCPNTEGTSARLARLPLYPGLDANEVGRVVEAVRSFKPRSH